MVVASLINPDFKLLLIVSPEIACNSAASFKIEDFINEIDELSMGKRLNLRISDVSVIRNQYKNVRDPLCVLSPLIQFISTSNHKLNQ